VGLVATVVWNRRTGNIVGGHQRLAALDALEADGDYELDVSVVDLDPVTEASQNVFLNNPIVQGTWDMDALGALMREDGFDVEATGFDPMDVQVMFDDAKLAPMFNGPSNDLVMDELAKIGAVRAAPAEADADGAGDSGGDAGVEAARETELAKWKDIKERQKERLAQNIQNDDTEFYTVVSFVDATQRAVFCSLLGADPKASYVDGGRLFEKLKLRPARA
jgi:hypothetical protein